MSMNFEYEHAPMSNLDYGFDWKSWLAPGETIVTSTWTLEAGLTGTNEQNIGGITSIFIFGGVAGSMYKATNKIVTSALGGVTRTDSRTLKLICKVR